MTEKNLYLTLFIFLKSIEFIFKTNQFTWFDMIQYSNSTKRTNFFLIFFSIEYLPKLTYCLGYFVFAFRVVELIFERHSSSYVSIIDIYSRFASRFIVRALSRLTYEIENIDDLCVCYFFHYSCSFTWQ